MESFTAKGVARMTLVRILVRDAMTEGPPVPAKMLALKDDLVSKHMMTEGDALHSLYVCGLHDGIEFVQRMRDQEPPTNPPAQEPEA